MEGRLNAVYAQIDRPNHQAGHRSASDDRSGHADSVYEGCLYHEPAHQVTCKGVQFDEGFRADILGDRQLIVEIKAVANIVPAPDAQVLTRLRISGLRLGPLFNFDARLLKDGLRRIVVRAASWFSVLKACSKTTRTEARSCRTPSFLPARSHPAQHAKPISAACATSGTGTAFLSNDSYRGPSDGGPANSRWGLNHRCGFMESLVLGTTRSPIRQCRGRWISTFPL